MSVKHTNQYCRRTINIFLCLYIKIYKIVRKVIMNDSYLPNVYSIAISSNYMVLFVLRPNVCIKMSRVLTTVSLYFHGYLFSTAVLELPSTQDEDDVVHHLTVQHHRSVSLIAL